MQSTVFHIAVLALFLVVFLEASLSKILAMQTPEWFAKQFSSTWLAKIAPVPLLWWTIALCELGVAVLFGIAAVRMEFLIGVSSYWTGWGLLGAMGVFTILCFGQRISFDFTGAANSFYYAGISGLLWYVVSRLP